MAWFKIARRDNKVSEKTHLFACEDHFDIENDFENLIAVRMGYKKYLELKPNILPKNFDCQVKRPVAHTSSKVRSLIKKRKHKELLDAALDESEIAQITELTEESGVDLLEEVEESGVDLLEEVEESGVDLLEEVEESGVDLLEEVEESGVDLLEEVEESGVDLLEEVEESGVDLLEEVEESGVDVLEGNLPELLGSYRLETEVSTPNTESKCTQTKIKSKNKKSQCDIKKKLKNKSTNTDVPSHIPKKSVYSMVYSSLSESSESSSDEDFNCDPDLNISEVSYPSDTELDDIRSRENMMKKIKEKPLTFLGLPPENRGFKNVDALFLEKGCSLVRPPSVYVNIKPTKEEVKETKNIASLRIIIENVIGRIRHFKLLAPHACVPVKNFDQLDYAVQSACGLINLQNPVRQNNY
ncbi:hypothetical protein M8J76_007378 [Diaphorina citri]|nr:hypothetical protein M8J76_003899 [Diaphorina citri]KAI5745010.1 hypothetical protein M8J76_007378 [Diaphorina citri]